MAGGIEKRVTKTRPESGIDPSAAPEWWLTRPEKIREFLESLDGVNVEEIGETAGGRTIIAASWGEPEPIVGRTSLSLASAMGSGVPEAFFGKKPREKQTLMFLGAAHGNETEGTVAALNFLNVLVTGRDLRGVEHPQIAEEGRQYRFLIIPIHNVDGRERNPDHEQFINCDLDYYYMICQGRWKNGDILHWPIPKQYFPMPLDELEILGSYFNDAGVNLVYDLPFGYDCQPETDALIKYVRRELPDLCICSHSNGGSLVVGAGSTVPPAFKSHAAQIGAAVGMGCARRGFSKFRIPRARGGTQGGEFYQSDGVYHASGALPLLIEFPWGYQNDPDNHDDILDIGMTVIHEICFFGNRYGLRPKESRQG